MTDSELDLQLVQRNKAQSFVAVIGENVADAIVASRTGTGEAQFQVYAGGGPANTAVALGRLGTPTRFIGRLPESVLGSLFTERFENSNVDLSLSVRTKDPATLAITSIDKEGIARYEFYLSGTADWQWQSHELDGPDINEAACIHTGSLALIMEPGNVIIEQILKAARLAATISIDPNPESAVNSQV
ncbi:MAG: PfkB family carbohydrate kinase [Candidatus Dormibacteraceae bacterium]